MKKNNQKIYYGTIIDASAGIIVLNSHFNLYPLSKELSGKTNKKVHIICGIWWSIESLKEVVKLLLIVTRNKIIFPDISFSFLCNTVNEFKILKFLKLDCIYCSNNCFVDESIFNINNIAVKKYDAVYNAVLSPFKRHFLAKEIRNLALVTYRFENKTLKNSLTSILNSPIWLNYLDENTPVFLTPEQLNEIYNQSYTGVALSKVEGAMYASTEYLLSGIPVVSTRSKGGRDVFYTDYNSKIVESDPQEIAKAIQEFKNNKPDPQIVREETLEIINQHRVAFITHVNKIIKEAGHDYDISETWDKWFVNKLRNNLTSEEVIRTFRMPR